MGLQGKRGVRIELSSEAVAGIPAIWNTMLYGIGDMSPVRCTEAFLKINHVTGLDCQSCVWPSPDKKRKIFEFCENGAKAVSDESTKNRITPEFFAQYSIEGLAAKSDYWLAGTSDVAHGASRQRDTLSADLLAGGLQNDRRRALFLNPLDMQAMNLKAGQIVDIYSHPEGEVRMAPRFAIVPYQIARRSAAAYYRRRMF